MDSFVEETGILSFVKSLQHGSLPEVQYASIIGVIFIQSLKFVAIVHFFPSEYKRERKDF